MIQVSTGGHLGAEKNTGPSDGKKNGKRPPVFSKITAKAAPKNRLAVWPSLFANAKSRASVNPENRVAMAATWYRLIWNISGFK